MSDAITLHSQGGLGNQLFGFICGLAASASCGGKLRIDIGAHQSRKQPKFQLQNLIHEFSSQESEPIEVVSVFPWARNKYIRRILIPRYCSYAEKTHRFQSNVLGLQPGSCINGYFQSSRYFESLSEDVQLKLRMAMRRVAGQPEQEFSEEDIVIHVRRGDYMSSKNQKYHGVLGSDYYAQAILNLRNRGHTGQIHVVAESFMPDFEAWIKRFGKAEFIGGNDPWSDLGILMSAPSLIIANSTFSWMGGWFGNATRAVCAPNPWFANKGLDSSDLVPELWQTIPHDFAVVM